MSAAKRLASSLALVQLLAADAAAGHGGGGLRASWRLQGPNEEVSTKLELIQLSDTSTDAEDPPRGFLERNLPWLMPLPYLEGRAVELVNRLDFSALFPDQAGGSLSALTPELEKTGEQMDKAGRQFADEFKPESVEAKSDKLARDLHPETVARNLERDLHPDKLRPEALAEDIPRKLGEHHPILDKDGKPKDDNTVLAAVISSASSVVVWLIFVAVAAVLFRQTKDVSLVDLEAIKGKFKDQPFSHGPFSCFEDMDVCCWSFWCGAVQWADSMSAIGSMSFWLAFALFLLVSSINLLTGVVVWALAALLFAYFRQDLRNKLELENDTSDMVKDFAMWCCCACCAIAQEARQVKVARQLATSDA